MSEYIKKLIAEGEHQMLDFKFEISDSRKISRTMAAFANTDGGRLLIGVKDNGAIAGIRTEEEFFMVEGASRLYCKPEVPFRVKQWKVDRKTILEVTIETGKNRPYRAMDDSGNWRAFIRQRDQNFVAHNVTLKVWQLEKKPQGAFVKIGHAEHTLLNYLDSNPSITIALFRHLSGISQSLAEDILANFMLLKILETEYREQDVIYRLKPGYEKIMDSIQRSYI